MTSDRQINSNSAFSNALSTVDATLQPEGGILAFFLLPLLQPHIGAATVLVDELDARHPNYVVAFSVAPIRVQIDILAKNNLLYSLDYFHFISQILQLTGVLL